MISVCAPYWNQQAELDEMVEMYGRLYPDLDYEIVIADDGSPQPAAHPACKIVRLPAKNRPLNPCVPINRAVDASTGELVVLTKVKVRHEGPVLTEMLDLLEREDDYVTARCMGIGYSTETYWLAGPDVDYTSRGRLPVPDGAHFHFLALLHRSLWEKAGGFDEGYRSVQACDDNDWLWRLHAAGARFICADGHVTQERSRTRWRLPHGGKLFRQKWPAAG